MSDPLTPEGVAALHDAMGSGGGMDRHFATDSYCERVAVRLANAGWSASRGSEDAASALSALRAEVAEVARRMEVEFAYLEVTPGRVVSGGVAARTFRPMAATLRRLAKAEPEGESRG